MSTPISEPISIAPQANLALYGALDDILAQAIEDGDAETAALVNQYLPGAVEYPGWSNELREIFGPAQPSGANVGVTVAATLNGILESDARLLTAPGHGQSDLYHRRSHPLRCCRPRGRNATCSVTWLRWPARRRSANPPDLNGQGCSSLCSANAFTGGRTGLQVIQSAADEDWVKDIIAAVPQCSTSVVTSGGLECVSIDVEIQSDESLWPTCSPSSTRAIGPMPIPGSSARCTGRPNAFPPTNGGTSGRLSGSARLPPTAAWGSDNGFDSSRATRLLETAVLTSTSPRIRRAAPAGSWSTKASST